MQINNISAQENINFGTKFTNSSIRLLKRTLPEMIKGEEFLPAQKALKNLVKTKKRNDNLLIKITNFKGYGLNDIIYGVKHADTPAETFVYPNMPIKLLHRTPAEEFLINSEYIKSDRFVQETERIINRRKNMNFLDKLSEDFDKLKDNFGDFCYEAFSFHEIQEPNGQKRYYFGIFEDIKDYFSDLWNIKIAGKSLKKGKNRGKYETLTDLINQLK